MANIYLFSKNIINSPFIPSFSIPSPISLSSYLLIIMKLSPSSTSISLSFPSSLNNAKLANHNASAPASSSIPANSSLSSSQSSISSRTHYRANHFPLFTENDANKLGIKSANIIRNVKRANRENRNAKKMKRANRKNRDAKRIKRDNRKNNPKLTNCITKRKR